MLAAQVDPEGRECQVIEGGWVCRACWKPNRQQDSRCYRCKTPREQQLAVMAGSLKEQVDGTENQNLDANLGIVANLVSWPMWLSGWLQIIVSVLLVPIAGLVLLAGEVPGALFIGFAALFGAAFGYLYVVAARNVRQGARWAYALAAVAYLIPSVPTMFGLVDVPPEALTRLPDWYPAVQDTITFVYFFLGLLAAALLVLSLIRGGGSATRARSTG